MRHYTLPLLAMATALGACGPINRSVETVHHPVVSRADYVFDVAVAGMSDPGAPEARRVDAWLTSLDVGYGDNVTVEDPDPYGMARSTLAALLAERGLLIAGEAPPTEGALAPGMVRVVVSRSNATVSGCPDWRRPSAPEYEASTMSNYGCATASNLAAMVADPADLVRGQNGYGSDAQTVNKAVKVWRDHRPTGIDNAIKAEATGGK